MGRKARLKAERRRRRERERRAHTSANPAQRPEDSTPTTAAAPPSPNGFHGAEDAYRFDEPAIADLAEWVDRLDATRRPVTVDRPPLITDLRALVERADLPHAGRLLNVLDHMDQALASLSSASELAAADAADPDALLDTQGLQESLTGIADHIALSMVLIAAALRITAEDQPLPVAYHHGERWGGKLSPRQIVDLTEQLRPDVATTTYLAGRADQALANATTMKCSGGPSSKPCSAIRVRRADGTRAESCWAHLTAQQKAEIRAERQAALTRPCTLCDAAPNQPCLDDRGVETTIHHYRLRTTAGQPRSAASSRRPKP